MAGGINNVSAAKRKEFEARQLVVNGKNQEIIQSLQTVTSLDKEAKETENLNSNTQSYIRSLNTLISQEQQRLQGQSRVIDSGIRQAETEARVAEAAGDTEKAIQKQVEADNLRVENYSNKLAQQYLALEVLENERVAMINAALADGTYTEAEQASVKAQEDKIAAQKDAISATESEIEASKSATKATEEHGKANEQTYQNIYHYGIRWSEVCRSIAGVISGHSQYGICSSWIVVSNDKRLEETSEELEKLRTHLAGTESAISRNAHNAVMFRGEFMKAIDAANNTWLATISKQ